MTKISSIASLLLVVLQLTIIPHVTAFAPNTFLSTRRATPSIPLKATLNNNNKDNINNNVNKNININKHPLQQFLKPWKDSAAILLAATILFFQASAFAIDSKVVGEIKGSGLFFKDILTVERFDDPKVRGVTLYVSTFQRPLTERLAKDFFSDPSYASVGCAKTGKTVEVADNIAKGTGGEEVFEESRSILFKTLRVQRIYDEERNTVEYVTFNTRIDKNSDDNKSRFKSSICAVSLD